MITQQQVINLFDYDQNTGNLIRRTRPAYRVHIGDIAGGISSDTGYMITKIDGKQYLNHRIVFLHQKGYLPKFLDHKDCDRLNNRIGNLRECTSSENSQNRKISENNSSGVKGVYWEKKRNKWRAQVCIKGAHYHLGRFNNIEDAKQALIIKRLEIHKGFANHG